MKKKMKKSDLPAGSYLAQPIISDAEARPTSFSTKQDKAAPLLYCVWLARKPPFAHPASMPLLTCPDDYWCAAKKAYRLEFPN